MPQQTSAARVQELRAMPYGDYLKTPEWLATQRRILERDIYQCQGCHGKNILLVVHHYTLERLGSERDDDLVTLCEGCRDQLRRLLVDSPKLSFFAKCGWGFGTFALGTIGIEGFL